MRPQSQNKGLLYELSIIFVISASNNPRKQSLGGNYDLEIFEPGRIEHCQEVNTNYIIMLNGCHIRDQHPR
ncbi:hypothetical protein Y032_0090g2346 [Ancylostoma ceylanicum]|uniref:Uncharacterized protein n=1 Tax=Ancylostoma ceylanicum TaxID=53326 RepID=A0A016TMN0_9BILA|nr:hypothetical protein Y032_0090g2346 [Ancylostoma ceylanicum]